MMLEVFTFGHYTERNQITDGLTIMGHSIDDDYLPRKSLA